MAAATGVKQVVGRVLLAVLSQPMHEFGHAIVLRASTGVWPRIGVLSVQPLVPVGTKAAALVVLAVGDLAVLAWWTGVFVWMRRARRRDWALVGNTFVLLVVLLEWLTAAIMFPFGRVKPGRGCCQIPRNQRSSPVDSRACRIDCGGRHRHGNHSTASYACTLNVLFDRPHAPLITTPEQHLVERRAGTFDLYHGSLT
jgi:hypothetical protein